MKKVYLLLVLNLLFINLQAQNFDWAKREGLWAYDYGYGITTDNAGNVYTAGKYELNSNFSGTTLPDQGNHDIYVAQYSSTGTLNWIQTAGGTLGDYAHAIACDGSNYVYIAGEIEGDGVSIAFVGTTTTLTCIGDNDIFLAKYDLSGNLVWAKQAGWWHSEKALGITYDQTGNIFICGYFNDTTYFETTRVIGYGDNDIFVAKYDMDGNFQWVQKAGSAGRDEAKSIQCDAAGNVYICGMYSNGAVFGIQTLPSPNGYYNNFLAKYASDGTLSWVKTSGGDYDDVAWSLTIDNMGKIYIAGEYNAYALFDNFPLTTSGNADAFVACYDAAGAVQWATSAGGILTTGNMITRARGIGCDGTNIFITGQFGGAATFGAFNLTAADSSDIFMAGLNNSGDFVWAISVGGAADAVETLGYESGNTICGKSGSVYATGSLLDGGIFGNTNLSPYTRTDIFITKITPGAVSIGEDNSDNYRDQNKFTIYPNPGNGNFTIDLTQLADQKNEMTVFNYLGQIIDNRTFQSSSKVNIDLSAQMNGIYFIEIKAEQMMFRKKIIIQ